MRSISRLAKRLSNKTAYMAVAAATVGLVGCSGGSDTIPAPTPTPGPTISAFDIVGAGSFGRIRNGYVTLADPTDGTVLNAKGEGEPLDRSDAVTGLFNVSVDSELNYSGAFIKVIIAGGPTADGLTPQMVCDVPEGCNGVAFGQPFDLTDPNIRLVGIVPTPADGETVTVYLNAFSTIAAARAESLGLTSETLATASSTLAEQLGLTNVTDFTQLRPVDLTVANDGTVSGDVDATNMRLALLGAGFLAETLNSGVTIDAALDGFISEYNANGGQFVQRESVDNPLVISREELLGAAEAAGEARTYTYGNEVVAEIARLQGEFNEIRTDDSLLDELTDTVVDLDVTALDKAKQFVQDLQDLRAALQSDATQTAFNDLGDRIVAAVEVMQDDNVELLEATLFAVQGGFEAYNAQRKDDTLSSFVDSEGLEFGVSTNADGLLLTLTDQVYNGTTLNIALTFKDGTETTIVDETTSDLDFYRYLLEGEVDFTLAGSVENENSGVTINTGTLVASNSSASYEVSDNLSGAQDDEIALELSLDEATLSLDGTFYQRGVDDGLLFDGLLDVSVLSLATSDTITFTSVSSGLADITLQDIGGSLSAADLSFSGRLSEGGEGVGIAFAISAVGDDLSFNLGAESVDFSTYTTDGASFTVTIPDFGVITRGIIPLDAALAEVAQFTSEDIGGGRTVLRNAGGQTVGMTGIVSDEPVFRSVISFESGGAYTTYAQSQTVEVILNGAPTDAFLNSPPTDDAIAYWNGAVGENSTQSLVCLADRVLLVEPALFAPEGGAIGAQVVANNYACSFALEVLDFGEWNPELALSTNEDAVGDVVVSGSIRQDVAGLNAEDPEVKISGFGLANVVNNGFGYSAGVLNVDADIDGEALFAIEFAGRRFETNLIDFTNAGEISLPITVKSEDGVVLSITQDTNGDFEGTIVVDGQVQATVDQDLIVDFSDGAFTNLL